VRRYANFWLLVLVLVSVLALAASCSGSASNEQGSAEESESEEASSGGMQGMEHSGMDMSSGQMMDASQMLMQNGEYSDERFINAMVPHHQGAIDMANVALENAEHPEIQQLAQNIISDQQSEIDELKAIKQREYGTSEVPTEANPEEMKMMGMMADPKELANQQPFDKAFIDAMIPHHQSAIDMANVAFEQSSDAEIKNLALGIVTAQQQEIQQMIGWRQEWYPGD
jgi:uncharacterized protein (DUF305 family)